MGGLRVRVSRIELMSGECCYEVKVSYSSCLARSPYFTCYGRLCLSGRVSKLQLYPEVFHMPASRASADKLVAPSSGIEL